MISQEDFYQDGIDACAAGVLERDCPHAEGSARVLWFRGFRDFLPIRAEWEDLSQPAALEAVDSALTDLLGE